MVSKWRNYTFYVIFMEHFPESTSQDMTTTNGVPLVSDERIIRSSLTNGTPEDLRILLIVHKRKLL